MSRVHPCTPLVTMCCALACGPSAPEVGDGTATDDSASEGGETSDGGVSASGALDETGISHSCGDGQLDESEDCDDGNQLDADGCNADCRVSGSIEWATTPIGSAGVAVVAGPEPGVTIATVTSGPAVVLTHYAPQGATTWSTTSPPDMVLDALTTAGDGLAWALRSVNGPTQHLLQGLDGNGSVTWTEPGVPGFGAAELRVDAVAGLPNGDAVFGGLLVGIALPWQIQIDAAGSTIASLTLPEAESLRGLAPYEQGALSLTSLPTRASFRSAADAQLIEHSVGLPSAAGAPFAMPRGTFAYLGDDGSTIVRLDVGGPLETIEVPSAAGEVAVLATGTPTGHLVTVAQDGVTATVTKWTVEGTVLWSTPVTAWTTSVVSDPQGSIYVIGTVDGDDDIEPVLVKLRP